MANEKLFTAKAENYSNARPGYSEEFFKYFKNFVTDKTKYLINTAKIIYLKCQTLQRRT